MDKAGFWFIYVRLRRAGLYPWCAARLAFVYRGRWPQDTAGQRLGTLMLFRRALQGGQ